MSYQVKNTFFQGKVDTDSAHEYVSNQSLVSLENFDLFNQGENFVAVPSKGNFAVTTEVSGKELTFLGGVKWNYKAYLFYVRADDDAFIYEYDSIANTYTAIFQDTSNSVGFPEYETENINTYVLSAEVVDDTFLYWTWGVRQADGSLIGLGEPKRINIEDSKNNLGTYTNTSGNYDRPAKLFVSSLYSPNITNNQLKYGSYIFYKRLRTKYDEYTILSYPSDCIDISEGFGGDLSHNLITISGFTVDEDVVEAQILLSRDSDATFEIVKSIDTVDSKTVSYLTFDGANEYPVLGAQGSEIINNNYPLTATEIAMADNRLVMGDITTEYKFEDDQGDPISKNTPFSYTTTSTSYEVSNVFPTTNESSGSVSVGSVFTVGRNYRFTVNVDGSSYDQFEILYDGNPNIITNGVAQQFGYLGLGTSGNMTSLTVGVTPDLFGTGGKLKIDEVPPNGAKGLNADFRYKGGIVFMDDKSRGVGATNLTDIFHEEDGWTFSVKPNMSASGITPPYWATKYMFVRDKVNTALSYSIVGFSTPSPTVKSGYNYLRVETPYYTNYLAAERGNTITVYSKSLEKDIQVTVLTVEDRSDEGITVEGDEYIYVSDEYVVGDGSLILYRPSKETESKTEVLYETSDVYTITNGVFDGDIVDELKWYDTKVGYFNKTFSAATGDKPMVIMKTDKESLRDINHLGRAAYTYVEESNVSGKATIMASQPYTPESNFNGLSDFAFGYDEYIDLNRAYGAIEKLHYDETNLLVGQKRKWSRIQIGKQLISTASGSGALQVSGKFLNEPVVPIAGDYGITDKRSFDSFGFRKYFVDANSGILGRISMDGISVINASRSDEIIALCQDIDPQEPVVGYFDQEKNEYVTVFHDTGDILRFSETSKESVGNYKLTNLPYFGVVLNNVLYTSTQSSSDLLWKESVGLGGGDFYGVPEAKHLAFVSNIEPNVIKDFISMSINGVLHNSVASGSISMDVDISTQKNITSLDLSDFHERENVWYSDIMQDELDDGLAVYGVGTVASIDSTTQLTLKSLPNNIRVGGVLQAGGSPVGTVQSVDGKVVVFTSNMSYTPSADEFLYTQREGRIEGESIKGNTALFEITITDDYNRFFDDDIRIFSVTTNINPSSNTE